MLKRLFATNNRPYVPGWNRTREVRYNLSGVEFSMQVPYSTAPDGANRRKGELVNIFDPDNYPGYAEDALPHRISDILSMGLFGELWESKGTLVGGRSAGMFFDVGVRYAKGMPDSMSCFNPRHFQQVIDRVLYYSHYGPTCWELEPAPVFPVGWQVVNIRGVDFVRLGVKMPYLRQCDDFLSRVKTYRTPWYYYTPLSDRHVLCVSLSIDAYHADEAGFQHCAQLMDRLVASTQLINLPKKVDLSAIDHPRAPFKWQPFIVKHVDDDPDYLKWYYKVVQEGSPPPPYRP